MHIYVYPCTFMQRTIDTIKANNIILRPGFMAKWIEILYLAPLMKAGEPIPQIFKRNLVRN